LVLQAASLQDEQVKPRSDLPPLLVSLAERKPEKLHYLGVSYGLTQQLFNFWKRLGMLPVYLRQTPVRQPAIVLLTLNIW
jgi:N-acetyltransferase 10